MVAVAWRVGSSGRGSTGDRLRVHSPRHAELSDDLEQVLRWGFMADVSRHHLPHRLYDRHVDNRTERARSYTRYGVCPPRAPISSQPIFYGGIVYWADWKGVMHATTSSGKALWSTPTWSHAQAEGLPLQPCDLKASSVPRRSER